MSAINAKLRNRILENYEAAIRRAIDAETDEQTEAAYAEAVRYDELVSTCNQLPAGIEDPIAELKRDLGIAL